MGFDEIIVLGAGAIGSTYGGLLSRNHDVILVGNKLHVDAVNSHGLRISGDMNETFRPRAMVAVEHIPERTLVLLTTKAYDSEKVVRGIKKHLRKDTTILVLQNGLGNEETVKNAVGAKAHVLRGITSAAAESFKAGETRYWRGVTIIERNETSEEIASLFCGADLKTILSDNMNQEVWNKLIANCVINPLTAIFLVTNREIRADPLESIRHGIVSECIAVGKTAGMRFPSGLAERIDEEIEKYSNFSSMCQDVMKGRKTEIDFLNGKIVELARREHVPTPLNETLVCMVKFLEERNGIRRED
jgi:2-dehydropantoate 2-reductase